MVQLGGNEPLDEDGTGMAMVVFDGRDLADDILAQRAVDVGHVDVEDAAALGEGACRPLPRRHRRT